MARLVKIRLMGDPVDVAQTAELLQAALGPQIAERSAPYPNHRGDGVRVYLTLVPTDPQSTATGIR